MFKNVKPIFFKAMTGIHAGTGSDLGLVDLPIQRERHSGLPKIESSGVKGCLRDVFDDLLKRNDGGNLPDDFVEVAFGPEDSGDKHAGSVAFTDARLLLFPVRSARGVFAYATCPYILKRLAEDFALAGIDIDIGAMAENEKAQVSSKKLLVADSGKAVLEEYTLEAAVTGYAVKLANDIANWLGLTDRTYVRDNLIILSDDDFKDFARNNTEIITRVKIDNKKGTVAKGALFTEELLPSETVMYSLVMASKIFIEKDMRAASKTVIKANEKEGADEAKYLIDTIEANLPGYIQIGGDETIGKGLCRVKMGV